MARPRTATAILDARGAFKNHPERRRDGEPVVTTPIGSPPESLSPAGLRAWQRIVRIAPLGVLTEADQMAVQMAAELWAEWEAAPSEFLPAKLTRLQSLLGTFGLTPSDRAKLSVPKAKESGNPFAQIRK